jgi:hypothetical protein
MLCFWATRLKTNLIKQFIIKSFNKKCLGWVNNGDFKVVIIINPWGGVSSGAIDRLVEMLAWCNSREEEIRRHAAAVVKKLVHSTHSCSRVAAVVGSLDNIVSLLCNDYEGKAPPSMLPSSPLTTFLCSFWSYLIDCILYWVVIAFSIG